MFPTPHTSVGTRPPFFAMGNCLSSEKGSADPGNPDPSTRQQDKNSSPVQKEDPNTPHKSSVNTYSASGARNGTAASYSSGSTTSPMSNVNGDNSDSSCSNDGGQPPSNGSKGNNEPKGNASITSNTNNNSNNASNQDSKGRQEVKILLLGSGESGKSTILKQMKIIHQNGYSQEDLVMYKTTVYKNLLDCAKSIVSAVEQFNYSLSEDEPSSPKLTDEAVDEEKTEDTPIPESDTSLTVANDSQAISVSNEELEFIKSSIISPDPDTVFDIKLAHIIAKLWDHPVVKKLFVEQRSQFYIMDSAPYFFKNVKRISDPDYIPDVSDILRARIKTTGIYETRFEMGKLNIHMFDVGGQRSERRKWINCFDNVTLIIFCVALSEYDQVLLEESSQNRMAESLVLFDSIINSRWFARTSVVLFLNKIDVFTEKLAYSPLENYFPDYTGGNDIKNAAKYILWRFNKLNRNQVNIYPHLTQATDTSNIRLVFAAVKETILQNSLRDSGIL